MTERDRVVKAIWSECADCAFATTDHWDLAATGWCEAGLNTCMAVQHETYIGQKLTACPFMEPDTLANAERVATMRALRVSK